MLGAAQPTNTLPEFKPFQSKFDTPIELPMDPNTEEQSPHAPEQLSPHTRGQSPHSSRSELARSLPDSDHPISQGQLSPHAREQSPHSSRSEPARSLPDSDHPIASRERSPKLLDPITTAPNSGSTPALSSPGSDNSEGGFKGTSNHDGDPHNHRCAQTRKLVLCFDGTGNKFGTNSNVVRFFNALTKGDDAQMCYYMPGIGTYTTRQFFTKAASTLALKFDEALARGLNDRVKEGYTFIMQNYRKGDNILLFGFSRGAYTARALAGMIGLLPAHNLQQVDFAFTVYNSADKEGADICRKFKQTFAMNIPVDFVGVWDTVSSVGLIPRTLPHSTHNDGVRKFRHALALDECRARFRPSIWGEPLSVREEMDHDPLIDPLPESRHNWVYNPPEITDVKEVWFAGCHADVGGGSHPDEEPTSLSYIPLRWMIKECYSTHTGLKFDVDALTEIGLNQSELEKRPEGIDAGELEGQSVAPQTSEDQGNPTNAPQAAPVPHVRWKKDAVDAIGVVYDQLTLVFFWWFLEIIPMLTLRQTQNGLWLRERRRNWGRGRYIPYSDGEGEVKVHRSVEVRIKEGYKPKAMNWKEIEDRVSYVI